MAVRAARRPGRSPSGWPRRPRWPGCGCRSRSRSGVVVAAAGTADLTELLRRADIAMYQAKQGGGSVAAYDSARDAGQHRPAGPAGRAAGGAARRRPAGAGAAAGGRPEHRRADRGGGADPLAAPAPGLAQPGRLHPTGREQRAARRRSPGTCWTRRSRSAAELGPATGSTCRSRSTSRRAACSTRGCRPRSPTRCAGTRCRPHRLVLEITETVVMSELEVIDEVLADAAVDGRPARRRRLRHRLLVADVPDPDRGGRVQGRPVLRDPDGRLAGGRGDRPDDRRARPASWACGWSPRAWRPPSSGPRWPSWAARRRRATTSSSRCRPTRSARCSARCATPPEPERLPAARRRRLLTGPQPRPARSPAPPARPPGPPGPLARSPGPPGPLARSPGPSARSGSARLPGLSACPVRSVRVRLPARSARAFVVIDSGGSM